MKSHFITITILFLFCLRPYNSQGISFKNDSTKKKIGLVVKADLLLPAIGIYYKQVEYAFTAEKFFGKHSSFQFTYLDGWQNTRRNFSSGGRFTHYWREIIFIPEYKFFLSKKKLHSGYYVGAFAWFDYLHSNTIHSLPWEYSANDTRKTRIGGGIVNGFQFYLFNHLTFDIIAGAGYLQTVKIKVVEENFTIVGSSPETYFFPRLAVNLGYKF
ncbi:MAG: DUF3575 domain-containing protein [Bacteroidia bacterium]|nr:DUF3575 domain-containing protein [Bacteroidia bacterium]